MRRRIKSTPDHRKAATLNYYTATTTNQQGLPVKTTIAAHDVPDARRRLLDLGVVQDDKEITAVTLFAAVTRKEPTTPPKDYTNVLC